MSQTRGRDAAAFGLIVLGLIFLLAQITGFSVFGLLWPLLIVVPGLIFLYYAFTGSEKNAALAVPGAMTTGTGVILMYQNLTGHWASWAYVWALYPFLLGLALVFVGRRTGSEQTLRTGNGFVKWGLFAFIALWALFELIFFGGQSQLISTLVPIALIGAGVFLLWRRGSRQKTKMSAPIANSNNGHQSAVKETLQDKIDAALAEDDSEIV